jgi:hypothetical protein
VDRVERRCRLGLFFDLLAIHIVHGYPKRLASGGTRWRRRPHKFQASPAAGDLKVE